MTVWEADRRVRRTRRNLCEALVALILERGYEDITVQEILDQADVGRSTFYAHFQDKKTLLLAAIGDLCADLGRDIDAEPVDGSAAPPFRTAVALFAHADRNRVVYQALCGQDGAGALVRRHVHELIAMSMHRQLAGRAVADRPEIPVDVAIEMYTSALLGLLVWWIDHNFPYSRSRMAYFYNRLTTGSGGAGPDCGRSTSLDGDAAAEG